MIELPKEVAPAKPKRWRRAAPAPPLTWNEAWHQERDEIRRIRARRGVPREDVNPSEDDLDNPSEDDLDDLVGLALSGGGIRSATFNLGLLQSMARAHLLRRIDYLSTVSGGGYIGGWLTRWIHASRAGVGKIEEQLNPFLGEVDAEVQSSAGEAEPPSADSKSRAPRREPPSVRWLRMYSNYLTPKVGFFSGDTWATITTYSRNFLLNAMLVLALILMLLLLPRLLVSVSFRHQELLQPWVVAGIVGSLLWAIATMGSNLRFFTVSAGTAPVRSGTTRKRLWGTSSELIHQSYRWLGGPGGIRAMIAGPLVLASVLGTALLFWVDSSRWTLPRVALACALFYWVVWIFAIVPAWIGSRRLDRTARPSLWPLFWTAPLAGGIAGVLIFPLTRSLGRNLAFWEFAAALTYGPPLLLLLAAGVGALQVGLMGRPFRDRTREWMSRLGAWLMICGLAWLVLVGLGVYGPVFFAMGNDWVRGTLTAGWVATTLAGVLAGRRTGAATRGVASKLIVHTAPYVFIGGLVAALSLGLDYGLYRLDVAMTEKDEAPQVTERDDAPPVILEGADAVLGQTMQVRIGIRDNQSLHADGFDVEFFLGTQPGFGGEITALGVRRFPELTGRTVRYRTSVPIPTSMRPGTYWLLARVDPENTIPETDEGNNEGVSLQSYAVLPELTVTSVLGASASAGDTMRVFVDVDDPSGGFTGNFDVDYHLATTPDPAGTMYFVGTRTFSGSTATYEATLTVPDTVPAGSYYVLASVRQTTGDPGASSQPYTIGPPLPDLEVAPPDDLMEFVLEPGPPQDVWNAFWAPSEVTESGAEPSLTENFSGRNTVHLQLIFEQSLRPYAWWPWLALLLVVLVLSYQVDVNEFSMHRYYRNRLIRCFLGASNRNRRPHPFTGFDDNDDVELASIQADAEKGGWAYPYPIIQQALNLVRGKELAWQERKAASFAMTPMHCGFELPAGWSQSGKTGRDASADRIGGFRPTRLYGRPERGIELGAAMAISGAAASPNMGRHSSPALTFLMTLFNVRLGSWLGNPSHPGRAWTKSGPKVALRHLVGELFGNTDATSSYVYVSDGAHFENLGIYELVRRRCRYLVVSDVGADPKLRFDDLANAIRKCSTDLDTKIDINVSRLRRAAPDEGQGDSALHFAVGKIHYPELLDDDARVVEKGFVGQVLYIKATLTGDEPTDVEQYQAEHPDFPHESTADQWFGESQFESYRRLGQHVGWSVFWETHKARSPESGEIRWDEVFRCLRDRQGPDPDDSWMDPGSDDASVLDAAGESDGTGRRPARGAADDRPS